jgi:hypothetical protein
LACCNAPATVRLPDLGRIIAFFSKVAGSSRKSRRAKLPALVRLVLDRYCGPNENF